MTGGEAARAVVAQMDHVREPTIAHIDSALATIAQMRDAMKAGPELHALEAMYAAANRIVATAGLFGLGELGEAAYSLCELVSRFQCIGRVNLKLIDVHTDGPRLLPQP